MRRAVVGGEYVYLSVEPQRARAQQARRRQMASAVAPPPTAPATAVVVEILVEVIHAAAAFGDPKAIAARLCARGVVVGVEQVEQVLDQCGLAKKKPASCRSPRSRR